MSTFKRIMNFILAMVMVAGMLPVPHAHAEETEEFQIVENDPGTTEETPATRTTQPEENEIVPETTDATEPASTETSETVAETESDTQPEENEIVPETTDATESASTETSETVAETEPDTQPEEAVGETLPSEGDSSILGSGNCGENLTWSLDNEGVLTIAGTGAIYDDCSEWNDFREQITAVILPEGLTRIGDFAFRYCSNLSSITIPSTLRSSGDEAFYECTKLRDIYISNVAAWCFLRLDGSYAQPNSYTSRLYINGELADMVMIPNGMYSLQKWTFENFSNLRAVYIPKSVRIIETDYFGGSCPFMGCSSKLRLYCEDEKAPSGWEEYWNVNYSSDYPLVTEYGFPAADFRFFAELNRAAETVNIPKSVTKIPAGAFRSAVKQIVIPESVDRIDSTAFDNCAEDVRITYGGTMEQWKRLAIGRAATCSDGACPAPFAYGSFENSRWIIDKKNVLYVAGIGDAGTSKSTGNPPWSDYKEYIVKAVIGEGITFLGYNPFKHYPNLTSIEIPSTLSRIAPYSFQSCNSMKEVRITDLEAWCNLPFKYDGDNPLYNGADLYLNGELVTELVFPEGRTKVKQFTFQGCTSITSLVIPEGVTSIEDSAFKYCDNLQIVSLPSTLQSIGKSAFYSSGLKSIELPKGLESIGESAFRYTYLKTITFPRSVNLISSSAFGNCEDLDTIIFRHGANDMLMIGNNGFYLYDDLKTTVKVPNAADPHSAISGYDWVGSSRDVRMESHYCMDDHDVITEGEVPPTCTQPGFVAKIWCEVCGKNLSENVEIPALGHTEVIDIAAVNPTCTEVGYTAQTHCAVCDEILSVRENIPALGHTEAIDKAVAPTCTETGLTEGKHCSVCREVIVAQDTVDALGHTEVIDNSAAPTCTGIGLTEGSHCDRCGKVFIEQKVISALGHDFVDGFCDRCGAPEKADYDIFSGKSLTLKPINPDTGKPYAAKQLTWSMDAQYDAFATLKNGKLTAKVNLEKVRTEVKATVLATGEEISYLVDIFPAVTQLEVKQGEDIVNGKTILLDVSEKSLTLKAEAFPIDTLEKITWTVSDAKKQVYATYTAEGDTLTINNPTGKAGTVTIKATVDAGVKKSVTVKVQFGSYANAVAIETPEKTTLRGGEKLTLTAAITEPTVVSKPGVVWTTSNKAAATVSNGKVTAKNVIHPMPVTITATSKDGQASSSIDLEIIPKNEGQLVLMENGKFVTNSTKVLNVGDTYGVTAAVITNGEPVPAEVSWTTAKATVAAVENGFITAVGAGTAKITATAGKVKVTMTVKVTTLVSDMTISTKDGKNLVTENGETIVEVASSKGATLAATVYPAKANKAVTWEIVEGAAYAKISTSGKLTANKDLTSVKYVTVRATAKDGSGCSETIRVRLRPLATGVQIYSQQGGRTTFSVRTPENWWVRSNTTLTVDLDETKAIQLLSHVYPYYGEDNARNAIQGVTWKSSSTKIATIDADGNVTFLKTGTVTITATANDGSGKKVTFKLKIV